MFQIRQDAFSGPMEKLLELIEERRLEITQVNLATVTADFITYIEELGEQVAPALLSDFVVIASRLLVLKSKVLLPSLELTSEEESDILDLEHRLKLYREFKQGGVYLQALWEKNQRLFGRPLLRSVNPSVVLGTGNTGFFYPSQQVTQNNLRQSLENLLHVVARLIPERVTVRGTLVTLQEKIAELTQRLQKATVTLKGVASKKDKEEVIVLFLAVLHMLSARLADVEQGAQFGDIVVTGSVGDGRDVGVVGNV